jgi:hypothetical protein
MVVFTAVLLKYDTTVFRKRGIFNFTRWKKLSTSPVMSSGE